MTTATITAAIDASKASFSLLQELVARKANVLGSGLYAVVIEENGVIYKIVVAHDAGYNAFMEFCTLIDSEHLPRIHSVTNYNGYNIVVMERLLSASTTARHDMRRLADVMRNVAEGHTLRHSLDTELVSVLELLNSVVNGQHDVRFWWDLHSGNFMFRADGCIVITDPFC